MVSFQLIEHLPDLKKLQVLNKSSALFDADEDAAWARTKTGTVNNLQVGGKALSREVKMGPGHLWCYRVGDREAARSGDRIL